MEYQATYGIDCGVSHGFDLKDSDYIKITDIISADNPKDAVAKAIRLAREYSQDYLSNPKTDYTTVKLLSLVNSYGRWVKQQALIKNPEVEFEDGCAVLKCSMLEHLLNIEERSEEGDF